MTPEKHAAAVDLRVPEVTITFDPSCRYVVLTFMGTLLAKEIANAFQRVVDHDKFTSEMPRIWDFRSADLAAITVAEMIKVGRTTSVYRTDVNKARVAFVTANTLDFGMSRVLAAHRELTGGAETNVFHTMDAALRWALT